MINPLRSPSGSIIETVNVRNGVTYAYTKGKTLWSSGAWEFRPDYNRWRKNENWKEKNGEFVYSLI